MIIIPRPEAQEEEAQEEEGSGPDSMEVGLEGLSQYRPPEEEVEEMLAEADLEAPPPQQKPRPPRGGKRRAWQR